MKTKTLLYFNLLLSIITLITSSCKKVPSYEGPLQIRTNKDVYQQTNDPIIVEVKNLTDSIATAVTSTTYHFIPFVYKFENNSWSNYWGMYCTNNCFCCKEISPGEADKDTIKIDFVEGTYRIGYFFTMKPDKNIRKYYTNIFVVDEP